MLGEESEFDTWSFFHFTIFLMVEEGIGKVKMLCLSPSLTLEKAGSPSKTISWSLRITQEQGLGPVSCLELLSTG